jgi:hypothetical protein
MINGLSADDAVTIGTDTSSNSGDTLPGGLYGSHAYAVLSYSVSTGDFTLYNPWGCDQPNTLSWSQLESTCDAFVVAVTTGSTPISITNPNSVAAAVASRVSAVVNQVSSTPSTAVNLAANYAAWSTVPANQTGSTASLAATGNTNENHRATIGFDRSPRHDSAAQMSNRPVAAGVDVVLANEAPGSFFTA